MDIRSIECKEVSENLKNGAIFVDVREPEEINKIAFDVPKVINIPSSMLDARYKELPKDKLIILADDGDEKSWRAAVILNNNGFYEVAYLKGGLIEWISNDLPIIVNKDYLSSNRGCGCCG
jgi:rhodanese-related sulfurtransferase